MNQHDLIPILPVPETVFFPNTIIPLYVVEPNYIKMIRKAKKEGGQIGVSLAEPVGESRGVSKYSPRGIFGAGRPIIVEELPDKTLRVLLQGTQRMKMVAIHQELPYLVFEAEALEDLGDEGLTPLQSQIERIVDILDRWLEENIEDSLERETFYQNLETLQNIVDYACFFLIQDTDTRQLLLENCSLKERIQLVNSLLRSSEQLIEDSLVANAIKEYETIEKTAKLGH